MGSFQKPSTPEWQVQFWRLKASGMWHCVAGWVVCDILEDYRACIFRVKMSKKKMKALQFFEISVVVWHLKWLESSATQLWESPITQVIFAKFYCCHSWYFYLSDWFRKVLQCNQVPWRLSFFFFFFKVWAWGTGRMILTGKAQIMQRKPVSVFLCLPQISHGLARD